MASQTLTGTQFAEIIGISDFSTKLHWIGSYTLLSQDPVANTSTLRLYGSIYLSNSSSQHYYSLGYNEKFTVAGTTLKTGRYDFYTPADNGYTLWGSTDRVITHNSDGTFPSQTYTITACSGHFNYGNGQSASGTISGIASIDRTAATPTVTVSSITANSFSLAVSTNVNCNKFEYSLDGGSTWITFSTTNGQSASVSITGLNPATTYALVVRVTKTYNEITSTASQSVSTLGFSIIDTAPDRNVAQTITITYHTQVANYYHKIQFALGSTVLATETIGKITTVGSKTYTSTYNFPATVLPSSESATITATLLTYGDSGYTNLIGSNDKTFTLTVPNASPYLPSATKTTTPYNTNTWLNSKSLYVGGYTAMNVAVTPSAGTGATVTSVVLTGVEYTTVSTNNFRTSVLPSGTNTFNIVVTDSRGRQATVQISQEFLWYSAPSVSSFSSQRGTYSNGTWTQSNTGNHIRIYLTASGSLSSQGNTVTKTVKATISGQQVNPNYTSGNYYYWTGTSADVSYLFTATVTDSVGQSSTLTLTVASAAVPFNLNTTLPAAAFGKVAEQAKTLELASDWNLNVGGDISSDGTVTADSVVTDDLSVTNDVTFANVTANAVEATSLTLDGFVIPDANQQDKYPKMKSDGSGLEWGTFPALATVATTGDYDDLSNKPTIPPTPNDYITEQGTSGNWIYRKYNSGVAECWGNFTVNVTGWNSWGNLYEGARSVNLEPAYPTGLFNATPVLNVTVWHPSIGLAGCEVYGTHSKDNVPSIIPLRPSTGGTGQIGVCIHSVGTWK